MRVVIIGRPADRARLRAEIAPTMDVVGEAMTRDAARDAGLEADAWLVVPDRAARTGGGDEAPPEPLTAREMEVLALVAEGLPNKAIAARLEISDQTVKFHVGAICAKLGAANRTDAVRRAIRRGLVAL
jgi:DNA-binding CsgD family transcriptional regulator